MSARSHTRINRRPAWHRSVRSTYRDAFNAAFLLHLPIRRGAAPTLADVWEDE